MIGKITSVDEGKISVKLEINPTEQSSLINNHIVFESKNSKLVGEMLSIDRGIARILLIGEIFDNRFLPGAIKKPELDSIIRKVNNDELSLIIGIDENKKDEYFYLGKTHIYDNYPINVKYNDFFSNHFAIFGNTGSGKSCSVARIIQNIFDKKNPIAYKANIFVFDVYGEYNNAFENINQKYPNINSKVYSTNLNQTKHNIINIPFWLLGLDDIALLLGATDPIQLPILQKALKLVQIFGRKEEEVIKHKNNIIAKALQQILYSGKSPSQIRDQILAVLTSFNTKELNSESKIVQPGYIRTLKQCLIIDSSGKINEMELVSEFIKSFINEELDYSFPESSYAYGLEQFKEALDFALISEGILKSDKIYDQTNLLRVRMDELINGETSKFFSARQYITKENYIKELLTTNDGKKAQIINFNMNYIDDRMAKVIVKIYSKMLFDFATRLKYRASFPFHIVIEEAHRYIQNDTDTYLLGYNIFDRIAKEGRKYGVILGLISQRPSELSETAMSQCANFLIFRMLHPKDLEYVETMVPNITSEITKKLKTLQQGTCVGFGSSFKIPLIVRFELPDPMPESTSCDIIGNWFVNIGDK
ncbi:MAG: ATP-binding protein [Firmicutes bacterium]|nr:ATP-binding protein [Bacillota bacterium]